MNKTLSAENIESFQKIIWDFYRKNKRILPWRYDTSPYSIFISEVMLQQTQVPRILTKYPLFLERFPDFKSLATASLSEALTLWQGIGYNRRAKYLQEAAKIIVEQYKGKLPEDPLLLEKLPGIGKATAASIVVYAFNKPIPFIETNVRRIFIHHFFQDRTEVHDKEFVSLVQETLDKKNPREWYWALMDYGTWLAKIVSNPNRRSKHYVKQSTFAGSNRQLRGKILKELLQKSYGIKDLAEKVKEDESRLQGIITQLMGEGFVKEERGEYMIK